MTNIRNKKYNKEKSLDLAVMATDMWSPTGTIAPKSETYYGNNLNECLHPELNSMADVIQFTKENSNTRVYGVYLRRYTMTAVEKHNLFYVKPGKGFYEDGGNTRASNTSNSNIPLYDDDFIPCVNEAAAFALESSLQFYFGRQDVRVKSVRKSIKSQFTIHTQFINECEIGGGTEFFDAEEFWSDRIKVFRKAVETVTTKRNVGKKDFVGGKYQRYYQGIGSDRIAEHLLTSGTMKDFYLLMKPRAGKNITMLLGLAKYIKAAKAIDPKLTVEVDFLSLWPSAFAGLVNDVDEWLLVKGVNIVTVNTQEAGWQELYEEYRADDKVDCIIRLTSMQSINLEVSEQYHTDDEREGDFEDLEYNITKAEWFRMNPAIFAVVDESDHGMRTTRSKDALTSFGYAKVLWLSGTDLYALKNLATPSNSYLYDLYQEIQDVKSGKIERRPCPVRCSLEVENLPLEELEKEEMNADGVSRALDVLFQATVKGYKGKYRTNTHNGLTYAIMEDGSRVLVEFRNLSEAKKLVEYIWYYNEGVITTSAGVDIVNPADNRHVFLCMPSVASCYALANAIKQQQIDIDHTVLLANDFKSASTIEQEVNAKMKTGNTVFITVGKMLRGAKAPWSCVVRFDRYSDYKIGLQLELRAQNADGDTFFVYDANPFRCSMMSYDGIRSRTDGSNIESEGRELHKLIPYVRKGAKSLSVKTWNDVTSDYDIEKDVRYGYQKDAYVDDDGLDAWGNVIDGSDLQKTDHNIKGDKDKREGSSGTTPKRGQNTPIAPKEKDERTERREKIKTLLGGLPMLQAMTGNQYDSIQEMLANTDTETKIAWLKKYGMRVTVDKIDDFLLGVIGKKIEGVNEQWRITGRKLSQEQFEWSMLSNPEKSDMHTSRKHILKKYEHYNKDFWNTWPACFDPGCGDGEFLSVWQEKLREAGCPEEEIAKRIFWADLESANVMLAAQRLGISINNGFTYQVGRVEETYINKRGVVKTRKVDITKKSFEEGLQHMAFDINKVHLIGNLPFTYGKGNAPVAIPVLTHILSLGNPKTINLVNDAGFLTSSGGKEFRELLKQHGWKYVGYNPQDLFDAGGATVHTVDLFCEQGYNSDIEVKSITEETFTISRDVNYIVDGESKELTEFLYSLLEKVAEHGCLLNRQETVGWKAGQRHGVSFDDKTKLSNTPKKDFVPFLYSRNKGTHDIKYVHISMVKNSKDHESWRVVFGYLPGGSDPFGRSIGVVTVLEPGIYLPNDPYRYFVALDKDHAFSIQKYITSNIIEGWVLPKTRTNRTFDAKTADGVTKFIPALPEGITIENNDDVFDFLETPEHIRAAVRARF